MNNLYRKDLNEFNTKFLKKIKNTMLKRIENEKQLEKSKSNMLIDLLSEIDSRNQNN